MLVSHWIFAMLSCMVNKMILVLCVAWGGISQSKINKCFCICICIVFVVVYRNGVVHQADVGQIMVLSLKR